MIEDPHLEGAFLTTSFYEPFRTGHINQVPILIGFNSEEYLLGALGTQICNTLLQIALTFLQSQKAIIFHTRYLLQISTFLQRAKSNIRHENKLFSLSNLWYKTKV